MLWQHCARKRLYRRRTLAGSVCYADPCVTAAAAGWTSSSDSRHFSDARISNLIGSCCVSAVKPTHSQLTGEFFSTFCTLLVPNSTTRTPAPNTGYEHHQRTSSQQFDTTNGEKFVTDMLRCWALALRCGKFVVELLWARPLVVSVGGVVQHVRSRYPCSGVWPLQIISQDETAGYTRSDTICRVWLKKCTEQRAISWQPIEIFNRNFTTHNRKFSTVLENFTETFYCSSAFLAQRFLFFCFSFSIFSFLNRFPLQFFQFLTPIYSYIPHYWFVSRWISLIIIVFFSFSFS